MIEIVPPQVCAFALGAVQDKPVVVTDKFGNKTIEARQILPITVVFDHRALDFGDVIPFLKKMDSIFAHPPGDPGVERPGARKGRYSYRGRGRGLSALKA